MKQTTSFWSEHHSLIDRTAFADQHQHLGAIWMNLSEGNIVHRKKNTTRNPKSIRKFFRPLLC